MFAVCAGEALLGSGAHLVRTGRGSQPPGAQRGAHQVREAQGCARGEDEVYPGKTRSAPCNQEGKVTIST